MTVQGNLSDRECFSHGQEESQGHAWSFWDQYGITGYRLTVAIK